MMVIITNIVVYAELSNTLDLFYLANRLLNVRYHPKSFCGLIFKHKKIGGTCFCFESGKIVCNGFNNLETARIGLRKYARLISKHVYGVAINKIKLSTISLYSSLNRSVSLSKLYTLLKGCCYEPEIFPGLRYKPYKNINFTVFRSGEIVITGVTALNQIDSLIKPTIHNIIQVCQ